MFRYQPCADAFPLVELCWWYEWTGWMFVHARTPTCSFTLQIRQITPRPSLPVLLCFCPFTPHFSRFAAESLPSSLLLLSSGVSAGRPCLSRPSLGSLHPRLFPAHVLTPSFLLFPAHASKHYPHVLVPVRANVQHQSHPGGRHR